MSGESHYTSIGLMSGTSMDAIDVALLRTDGESVLSAGPWMSRPYPTDSREALLGLSTDAPDLAGYEDQVTRRAFTACAIASAARMLPVEADTWVVVGGGCLNRTLVSRRMRPEYRLG